jgi:hypothetical protein
MIKSTGLGVNSGNKIFFGVKDSSGTKTYEVTAAITQPALVDAATQVTTGTVASGTAGTATGLASAPTLKVTCWTSTADVYIDVDIGMVSSVALASGKLYSAMVCYKLGASEFQCAAALVTGASSAPYGNVTWNVYGSTAAPAASDFTSTTAMPTAAGVLGNTAKYFPLFQGSSIDTSSGVTAATKNGTTSGFWNNTDFFWSATANTINAAGTTFACRVQYKNTRADATAATAVKTSLDSWVASTVGGSAVNVGSAVSTYAVAALTIPTTTTTTTTTTGATTIGLSLATLAAALATVVAF